MKPSNEGSRRKFDIVVDCLSYKKEVERGLIVETAGEKDSILVDSMVISAQSCKLLENGNLEMENGSIIVDFADYKQAKYNKDNRVTEFAVEKRKREAKKNNDAERVG